MASAQTVTMSAGGPANVRIDGSTAGCLGISKTQVALARLRLLRAVSETSQVSEPHYAIVERPAHQ